MKYLIYLALLGGSVLITACSDQSKNNTDMSVMSGENKESALEHAKKHLDPTYVCPMHPNIVKDEPGSCPICGMELVLKEQEEEMHRYAC